MFNVKNMKLDYRAIIFSVIFAALFTLTTFWGIALDNRGTIWVEYNRLSIFIFSIISYLIFRLFFKYLPKIEHFLVSIKSLPFIDKLFFQNNHKSFWNVFIFITIMHIPAILAYFPGIMTYDAFFQVQFFLLPEHIEVHPIAHSLLIYLQYLLFKITNSHSIAIFTYTIFQQCIMNLIFAYCTNFISGYTKSFVIRLFSLLFFALYPINCVFPLIATKDVLFSGFILLLTIISIKLLTEKSHFINNPKNNIMFVGITMLMLLFRHNGIYGYIIFVLLTLLYIFFKDKKFFKKCLILFCVPVCILFTINIIKSSCGIIRPPIASSIGIPLQQMGRVRYLHNAELSETDKELFSQFVTKENELSYNPFCVDNLKETEKTAKDIQHSKHLEEMIKSSPKEFVNLYLKWLKIYPQDYVDAFLQSNYHAWYVGAKSFNIYKFTGRISNLYILTDPRSHYIFGEPLYIISLNEPLRKYYDNLLMLSGFEQNIFLFMLFSIAINTWINFIGILILLYKRQYSYTLPMLFNIVLFMTILFGPVILFRYCYQNFLVIPLLFALCFGEYNTKNHHI